MCLRARSILGPLLFLIYINDLPNATNLFIKLYADDTVLCSQSDDLKKLENEVNSELKKVFQWLASNRLTLNLKKSKFMIISRKKISPEIASIPPLCGKSRQKTRNVVMKRGKARQKPENYLESAHKKLRITHQ